MDAVEFLGLRHHEDGSFSLSVTDRLVTPGRFLFGGCGLGAAVAALEIATGRPCAWATAQYLSYAPLDSEVRITTDLAVEGQRVTQARATLAVEDRDVVTVMAAFGHGELDAPPWMEMPSVPAPEECPRRDLPDWYRQSIFEHVETRVARGRRFHEIDGSPGSPRSALWARIPEHLSPSAATLAIVGDLVSGGATEPLGRRTRGRSLDNTVRVATLAPTEWILVDIHMHALVGGFGQGTAFLWSQDGVLLGTASQTIVARVWRDQP